MQRGMSMEIVLSKEDGTEFARFADAEELAQWAVRVCVVADNEIERLKDNAASLRTQRDYLMAAARRTLEENGHLADGDNCTLLVLKRAVETLQEVGAGTTATELHNV
jgi:CO dehydrogenase/acetyl-CoA synthase gamma subunit (corrinoid Fe-S protein)